MAVLLSPEAKVYVANFSEQTNGGILILCCFLQATLFAEIKSLKVNDLLNLTL